MNKRSTFNALFTAMILTIATACSQNDENSIVSSEISDLTLSETTTITNNSDEPVLSIEKLEINYDRLDHQNGTVVPVEYSVSGIVNGWSSSGIHISFDDRLDLQTDENNSPLIEKGDASEYLTNVISVRWQGDEPPEEIADQNMDNLVIITACASNDGLNGVIATINFIVPPDAQVGDVYKINFFQYKTDCFTNIECDTTMQNFAFENWQDGYIKII